MDKEEVLLLSLLLLVHLVTSDTLKDTITIGQTVQDGELIVSKGNKFALGFFSPGSSSYRYVGIWYYRLPEQAVLWVANRNNPIKGSSGVLSVNHDGNLVLYGDWERKVLVWYTNVSDIAAAAAGGASAAQLLDSGNFVLVQGMSNRIVWQSFDYPTNTLLQGMKHGLNRTSGMEWFLTSWRSADDPGTGNFSYRLNESGSPQFMLYKGGKQYWRSGPWPWRKHPELYNYSFINDKDEKYLITYFLEEKDSVLVRIMLDESGLLRRLTWHDSDGQWKEYWSVPKYRCDSYGQCGAYSKCNPTDINTFECDCLPGYEPKSPWDWYLRDGSGGCIRKRQNLTSICGDGEGFVMLGPVKIPDTSAAVWVDMNMGQLQCEQECLRNCSCTAYASIDINGEGTGCLAWYGELMDTLDHRNDGYNIYIRVDAVELAERTRKSIYFLQMKGMLSVLVLSVALAWFVLVLVFCLCLKRRKGKVKNQWSKTFLDPALRSNYYKDAAAADNLKGSSTHQDLTFFKFSTISAATNNFCPDNIIGQGGFGSVYKGLLPGGQEIAVKRLTKDSRQGIEEFTNEVMLIAKLQHRNLVKLLGCCSEKEEQMLIYEYLPNKSLDLFISDQRRRSSLDWRKRFDIIVGIARGILYLHQDSRLRIIHRDLKTSNILLDAEMNPKISDFGMARIFKGDKAQHKTNRVVGTYGYMSPEYAVFGKYSVKSDVFSFGIILLEIISGVNGNCFYQETASVSLIGHVWELWKEDRALDIVDAKLKESRVAHEVLRCIQIGLLCVQEDADDRPTMLEVLLMLNSESPLPFPKKPAFVFRKCLKNLDSLVEEKTCSVNDVTITAICSR